MPTQIPFVTRSEFLEPIANVIAQNLDSLAAGDVVLIELSSRGYPGEQMVTLTADDKSYFSSTRDWPDVTRFPVRIRAAATALRDAGLLGTFLITHKDGEMTIRQATMEASLPILKERTS
jgi:hypothetical protein